MSKYFKTRNLGNITVIDLQLSEFSVRDAQAFRKQTYQLVAETNNKFIVNFRNCVFIPSIALGVLINFRVKATKENGNLVLCSMSDKIRRIFNLTKLDKIFEIYKTEEEAIKSLSR